MAAENILPFLIAFLKEEEIKQCAVVCKKWNGAVEVFRFKKEVEDIHASLRDQTSLDFTKMEMTLLLRCFAKQSRCQQEQRAALLNSSRNLVLEIITDFQRKDQIDHALMLCEIVQKLFVEKEEYFDTFAELCGDLKCRKGEYLLSLLYYHKANFKGETKSALPECLHLFDLLMDDNRLKCINTLFDSSTTEKSPSFRTLDHLLYFNHELVIPISRVLYQGGYQEKAKQIIRTKLQYPLESLTPSLQTELEKLVQNDEFKEFTRLQKSVINFLQKVLDSVIPGFENLRPTFLGILESERIKKYLESVNRSDLLEPQYNEAKRVMLKKKGGTASEEFKSRRLIFLKYREELNSIRKEASKYLAENKTSIAIFQESITSKFKNLIKQIINDSIRVLSPMDCKFVILGLASLSRKEMTPFSDIEIAFIVRTKTKEAINYCVELSSLLQLRLAVFGETYTSEKFFCGEVNEGFQIDIGINVKNSTELIRTPSEMNTYLTRLQEDSTMVQTFTQFRYLAGNDKSLYREIKEQVRIPRNISQQLIRQDCEEFSREPIVVRSEVSIKKLQSFLVHTVSNLYFFYFFKVEKGFKSTLQKLDRLNNIFSSEFLVTLKECYEFLTSLRLANYNKFSKKVDVIKVKDMSYEVLTKLQLYHYGALLPLCKFAMMFADCPESSQPNIQPMHNPLLDLFEDYTKNAIPLSKLADSTISYLIEFEEEKTPIRYAEAALKSDFSDRLDYLMQSQYKSLLSALSGYSRSPLLKKQMTEVNLEDIPTFSELLSRILQKQTCIRLGSSITNMVFYIFNPELVIICRTLIQQLARNKAEKELSAANSEPVALSSYIKCYKMIVEQPMRDLFLEEIRNVESEKMVSMIMSKVKDFPLPNGNRISVVMEELEWNEMINKISVRDELMETIYLAMTLLDKDKTIDDKGEIVKFLGTLDYPHELWHKFCPMENILDPLLLKLEEIYKTLDKLIVKLKDKVSKGSRKLLHYLFLLRKIYQLKHHSLMEGKNPKSSLENEEKRKPIHGMTIGFRLLNAEVSDILFNSKGMFVKTNKYGKRKVTEAKGCFFKELPEYPAVEYSAGKLTRLLVGVVSPRTELVALKTKKGSVYYLLSKKVEGATLQDSWVSQPDSKLEQQEITNYSKLVISSLFTNPQDDIPPNFIVTPGKIDYNQKNSVSFMCIDNDHSFIDPIGTSSMNKQMISSNSIIFCQPHMKHEVDKEEKQNFQVIQPDLILEEWLNAMEKHNEFWVGLDKSLELKLRSGVIETFYNNLLTIKSQLTNVERVSHLNLLELVHRRVGKVYLAQLSKDQTPQERLTKISGHAVTTSLIITKNHPQQLAEVKTIPKEATNYISIRKAIEKLKEVHRDYTKNEFGVARANLLNGKPQQFLQASLPVQENIINNLDFANLDDKQQTVIINAMKGIPFKPRLVLRDCKTMTNESLNEILSHCPDLSELVIRGCNLISDISTIKNNCQTLSKLDLSDTSVKNVSLSKLVHLSVLKLSRCKNLEISKLELPPSLKHLDLSQNNLSSISSFKFKLPRLDVLNISDTKFNFKVFPHTKATYVDISKNEVHATEFSHFLLKLESPSIYLNCSQCGIHDTDVAFIVSSFSSFAAFVISRTKRNISVDLSKNPITSQGLRILLSFLAQHDVISFLNLRDIKCEFKPESEERALLNMLPAVNPNVVVYTSISEKVQDENELRMQHHLICGIQLARSEKLEECQIQFQKAATYFKIINKEVQQKSIEEISRIIISVAVYHITQTEYDTALLLLLAAEKITPNIPEIYSVKVEVCKKQKKINEANENIKLMIKKFPNFAEGYVVASEFYVSQQQLENAISVLTTAITSWTARLQEIKEGDLDSNAKAEEKEQLTKELLKLLLQRSEVYSETDPKQSIRDITTMIQLNPPIAAKQQLILLRARYHHQLGDLEASSIDIADAISKQSLITMYTHMGYSHIQEQQYDKAAKCLRTVIEKSEEGGIDVSATTYGILADCQYHSNHPEEAIGYYRKQIEEDPTVSQQNLGCLYRVMNKFEEAQECLKQSTTVGTSASPYAEYALFLYMEAIKHNQLLLMSQEIITNCNEAINHPNGGGLIYNQLDKPHILLVMQEELNENEFIHIEPPLLAYHVKLLTLLNLEQRDEVPQILEDYESKVIIQEHAIHYKMIAEIFYQMNALDKCEEFKQQYQGKKAVVKTKSQNNFNATNFLMAMLVAVSKLEVKDDDNNNERKIEEIQD